MEIAAAIASLAHSDPSIQSEAITIYENVQTPAAFDFKTCAALIGEDQPVQFRIFWLQFTAFHYQLSLGCNRIRNTEADHFVISIL
jgi:hypothetical protein